MDINHALIAFSALSQETRLQLFRLLIQYGSEGCAAGSLGEQLGVPHNTLSFHLSHMHQAGLVKSKRKGRSIIYTANVEAIESLVGFLVENCCLREQDKKSDCAPVGKNKKKTKSACC
jgi:DNA-binding transcriptional ArsR family regulator